MQWLGTLTALRFTSSRKAYTPTFVVRSTISAQIRSSRFRVYRGRNPCSSWLRRSGPSRGALAAEPRSAMPPRARRRRGRGVLATCAYVHRQYNVVVSELRFAWDERKNRSNRRKHRVSFEEAQTAFSDECGLLIDDPEHSNDEERFVLLGMSLWQRVLVVCHCYRADGDVIRIISARRADREEQADYNARWRR
jgi:uncharacterized DUF497 family protein